MLSHGCHHAKHERLDMSQAQNNYSQRNHKSSEAGHLFFFSFFPVFVLLIETDDVIIRISDRHNVSWKNATDKSLKSTKNSNLSM